MTQKKHVRHVLVPTSARGTADGLPLMRQLLRRLLLSLLPLLLLLPPLLLLSLDRTDALTAPADLEVCRDALLIVLFPLPLRVRIIIVILLIIIVITRRHRV